MQNPLGRGQQRILFPRIPAVRFGSEYPLLLPAQLSSVLLELENNAGRKGAPSSHCGSRKQQQSCADMQPPSRATVAAGSCLLGNETVLDGSRGLFIATGMRTAEFSKVTNFIGPLVGLQPQGRFVPVCTAQPWPVLGP
ncbi:hypothetical protein DV515_00017745 [Chloebia gouldiae]|uniref:Uncharacterized protein n=1 Tax=Chloebia gouldiae TaxID=44316 RepID=A0A3L8Q9F0_CHLGU|nr:hypothetical protein DV515_00017745 [Chloebia gouldiae]